MTPYVPVRNSQQARACADEAMASACADEAMTPYVPVRNEPASACPDEAMTPYVPVRQEQQNERGLVNFFACHHGRPRVREFDGDSPLEGGVVSILCDVGGALGSQGLPLRHLRVLLVLFARDEPLTGKYPVVPPVPRPGSPASNLEFQYQ